MPKSVEEAVRLATQQEAVETAQKRLCKQETSVEKETSTRIDGDFNEIAAVVKRGEEDMTVERLRRQHASRPKQAIKVTIDQMTSSLAPGVRDRVTALLWKYQDIIAINDNYLGHTQLLGHCIEMSDALPVRQPANRKKCAGAVEDPSQYAEVLKNRMQQAHARVLQYMELQQQRKKEYSDKGKFDKPWQGPFKAVEVLGPSVYRIADCANPKRQKVVRFNRLKPAPEEAEAPSPEVILWPSNTKTAGEQNVMKIPLLTLQLVITMKIFNLPLDQWSLRIDNLSLDQLLMFQDQDVQPESEGLPCTMVIQLKFLRP
ncbi:hypothetical protein EMCRGX_G007046 [Ephydatia muelleri]